MNSIEAARRYGLAAERTVEPAAAPPANINVSTGMQQVDAANTLPTAARLARVVCVPPC